MRPVLGRVGLGIVVALAFAGTAQARTDSPHQLALDWPAQGTVTSPFGYDGSRAHSGIDIGILRSLDVRAAAPGRVTAVGYQSGYEGYGNLVLVDVGRPFSTLYAHLAQATVRVGQLVLAGQRLGLAGCTGSCTGTHLHFELRRDGVAIDPFTLLPAP
ncbi:MAG: M23 family metallopeptidase [Actinomycetota bacterium]|nr:M23 family metallopeptidase [Actinomycetota bacterium]